MDGLFQVKLLIGPRWLKKEYLRIPENFGFKRLGFLLVRINTSCHCFVGSEWRIDSAHEGCNQAQSHADIRGEQSDFCLPELAFYVRSGVGIKHTFLGDRVSLLAHVCLSILLKAVNGTLQNKRGSLVFSLWEVFFFWIPANFVILDCVVPF